MVVAAFDDDEQVERIGAELRLVRQAARRVVDDARGGDFLLAPDRHRRDRRVGILDQRLDFLVVQLLAETQHLRRRTPFADDLLGFRLAQAGQVFRN